MILDTNEMSNVEEISSEGPEQSLLSDSIKSSDIIIRHSESGFKELLSLSNGDPSFSKGQKGEAVSVVNKGVVNIWLFIESFPSFSIFFIDLETLALNDLGMPVSGIVG